MGNLYPHDLAPAFSVDSMLALISALKAVVGFLKARSDAGDTFYFDKDLSEPIENIVEVFWSSYFPGSNDGRPACST